MTDATRFFEDVALEDDLAALTKGPLTPMHLMRWSAAIENWHRIHYDRDFAIHHDKLPDLLVNGSLKQQFLTQLIKDFAGTTGFIWKVSFQFRAMDKVGTTLTIWGRVTGLRKTAAFGLVDLETGIRNEAGVESAPGTATVALPFRDGPALPYPFTPPEPDEIEIVAVSESGDKK
jgi:hydroxyacyl-ACP dehydratase HTD2-like protein with hotdog domain